MRLPSQRIRQDVDYAIPLVNIVFLMLIFFMLFGNVVVPQLFEVLPPASDSEVGTSGDDLVILLGSNGQTAIAEREVALADLPELIRARLAETPGLKVSLKADAAAGAFALLDVIDAAAAGGVTRLTLLTVPQDR